MKARFDPGFGSTEEAWLGGIARMMVRKTLSEKRPTTADMSRMDPPGPPAPGDGADLFQAMLAVLTEEKDQTLFKLLYQDELTPEEAARQMGQTKWAIYKRRENMAEKLRRAGFGPENQRC
jgi:hypothetical protein